MIADKRVEAAAKVLRRIQYPAKVDPRPWRAILNKDRWLKQARKILNAAWKD